LTTGKETFEIWAPRDAVWSQWASPVAFIQLNCDEIGARAGSATNESTLKIHPAQATAYVIDLPGARAVRLATEMARAGLRPVPIFNGSPEPGPRVPGELARTTLVDTTYLKRELCFFAGELRSLPIAKDAAPVFVLDGNRMVGTSRFNPQHFDNRWIVYPQDFPSGAKLREHGIARIAVVQQTEVIADDLNDVLFEWQNEGLEIVTQRDDERAAEVRRRVKRTPRLLLLWRKFLRLLGFKTSGDLWDMLTSGSSGG
jgi:hypothetical protein